MTVMPSAKDISSGEVPFRVTDPERIPTQRYYDEEFYKRECEHLWPHVWQMACRLEQIPNVGDWAEYKILDKSVLIVRTRTGIKAYHNACRHRGVMLTEGATHGNCEVKGLVCPFHGWRWNMDGENTFVYGKHLFSQHQLEKADIALKACRVETWGGCAFINFDDNAPSYRESIGPVADRLEAHGVDKMRSEWWYAAILPANWKIAMEAFMEGFHVMTTHPQLQAATPARYNDRYGRETVESTRGISPGLTVRQNIEAQLKSLELLSEGMAGMVHPKEIAIAREMLDVELPDDPAKAVPMWYGMLQAQIYKQLKAKGEPLPDLNAVAVSHPVNAVEFLFPNYFLLSSFSSMSSYRIRPLGPESCIFELWSLTFFPEGQEPQVPMEPLMLPYDSKKFPPIPQQDYSNIPAQQKGLHAQGFEFMRLAHNVEGLISNYQRVIDGYLENKDPEKLAKATQMLGGNFDGKILDLGL
jgi:nitrite reductase/ring-hydroxylating ferredoxin subunit